MEYKQRSCAGRADGVRTCRNQGKLLVPAQQLESQAQTYTDTRRMQGVNVAEDEVAVDHSMQPDDEPAVVHQQQRQHQQHVSGQQQALSGQEVLSSNQLESAPTAVAALNAAAREQLVRAITQQEGISLAAQTALLQLVANMSTLHVLSLGAAGPLTTRHHISLNGTGQPATAASPAQQQIAGQVSKQPPVDENLSESADSKIQAVQADPEHQPVPATTAAADEDDDGPNPFLSSAAAATSGLGLFDDARAQQALGSPTGYRIPGQSSLLQPTRSQVTYKARVVAAAAGAVRPGPAGSALRLAGGICRSSSGSLADALLREAARAETGFHTAGLSRSDSLPDMVTSVPGVDGATGSAVGAALDAAHAAGGMDSVRECLKDIGMLDSLRGLDLPMTLSALPSLSFIMETRSDLLHPDDFFLAAHLQGQASNKATQKHRHAPGLPNYQTYKPQQQHAAGAQTPVSPGAHAIQGCGQLLTKQEQQFPAGSSTAARTAGAVGVQHPETSPSFAFTAAKLPDFQGMFGAHLQQEMALQLPQQQQVEPSTDASSSVFAAHMASAPHLHLPQLLSPSDAYQPLLTQQQQAPQRPCLSALKTASFQRQLVQQQQQAPPTASAADLAAFGAQLQASTQPPEHVHAAQHILPLTAPVTGGFQQLLNPRDTVDALLGQVNQELMAEAGARQYAALQFGTLDRLGTHTAATSAAAIGSGFELAAAPAVASAPQHGFAWQQQQLPCVAVPASSAFAGVSGWDEEGAVPSSVGFASTHQQQHHVMDVSLGGAAGAKQDVVRYSRIITCKTYLKRLNITQPMAEHLLPYHNLSVPAAQRIVSFADHDDDSPRGTGSSSSSNKPGSSYELLFKDEIAVVDCSGGRFRVQYEGVSCNQQKHLRLTSGWRDFIRAHGVEVGDTIVFERRGDERHVLFATVVKGDGPAGDEPAAKRKRVSRSQAVQRLE